MKRRRKRDPADRAVKTFMTCGEAAGILDESVITETDLHVLLCAVADALNACERARIAVKLAHGAVFTSVGYVLPVYPDAGERFAVRTMALTEFPVTGDGGEED